MAHKTQINIYIETTIHGPRLYKGGYGYVIEYIKKNGEPETRQGFGFQEKTTENLLALQAITEAINRLTKSCSLLVNTGCNHILNSYNNGWVRQWQKNGWRNAKGEPKKHSQQWETLLIALEPHTIVFTKDDNPYKGWLTSELNKEMEKQTWQKALSKKRKNATYAE